MSNAVHDLEPRLRAACLAVETAYRVWKGLPEDPDCLDALHPDDFAALVEAMRIALAASDAQALSERPPARLSPAYVDTIRRDVGADTLILLSLSRAGDPSVAISGAGTGRTQVLAGVVAEDLWNAVTGCISRKTRQAPPDHQEQAP